MHSGQLKDTAAKLKLKMAFVTPYAKQANRAERAIRTAKSHMIAVRAGFHTDCPHTYLDKGLFQIEMTLNIPHPFEYHPSVSAYEGIHGESFSFQVYPIAPVGSKVLAWDAPDHRRSWADHGVEAVYLGPAIDHHRAFEVPNTSASRITNTVWWFLHDVHPDHSLLYAPCGLAYPPTKTPRTTGRTYWEDTSSNQSSVSALLPASDLSSATK
jgi:hypothetical protein